MPCKLELPGHYGGKCICKHIYGTAGKLAYFCFPHLILRCVHLEEATVHTEIKIQELFCTGLHTPSQRKAFIKKHLFLALERVTILRSSVKHYFATVSGRKRSTTQNSTCP